jgi:hypothetical protein
MTIQSTLKSQLLSLCKRRMHLFVSHLILCAIPNKISISPQFHSLNLTKLAKSFLLINLSISETIHTKQQARMNKIDYPTSANTSLLPIFSHPHHHHHIEQTPFPLNHIQHLHQSSRTPSPFEVFLTYNMPAAWTPVNVWKCYKVHSPPFPPLPLNLLASPVRRVLRIQS